MSDVTVRPATADDHLSVMRILDSAMLETDADTVERRIDADTVLVAVDDDRIVGALVAVPRPDEARDEPSDESLADESLDEPLDDGARDDGAHVDAIAVQQRRRAQGIGSRLVDAAARRWTPLTATFDADVKPFYEKLGFDCEQTGARFRGVLENALESAE